MVSNLVQIFDDGAHWLDRNNIPNVRAQVAMNSHKMNNRHPWQLNQNLGSCFEATSYTALQIWPIWSNFEMHTAVK